MQAVRYAHCSVNDNVNASCSLAPLGFSNKSMPSAHLLQQATDACQTDASQTGTNCAVCHSVDYGLYTC